MKKMNLNNGDINNNDLNYFFEPNTISILKALDNPRLDFWNIKYLLEI